LVTERCEGHRLIDHQVGYTDEALAALKDKRTSAVRERVVLEAATETKKAARLRRHSACNRWRVERDRTHRARARNWKKSRDAGGNGLLGACGITEKELIFAR